MVVAASAVRMKRSSTTQLRSTQCITKEVECEPDGGNGDHGLYGGFNNQIIKKAESRIIKLKALDLYYTLINIAKMGNFYFLHRPYFPVDNFLKGSSFPTAKEAQANTNDVFSFFISEEVDKVELLYTKFISLLKSDWMIHTLLPLSPKDEICDVNSVCADV